MLLCAITDRLQLASEFDTQIERLVMLATAWAAGGVDYIQVREKDLSAAQLTPLTTRIVQAVRQTRAATKVLINVNLDAIANVARGASADGIHIPADLSQEELAARIDYMRHMFSPRNPVVGIACHSAADVLAGREAGADLALFAPVFEKPLPGKAPLPGQGLSALAEACRAARQPSPHPAITVLALGGITSENAYEAVAAGADGVAGIRLFLGDGWRKLR